jgi:hypothetical protein
MIRTILRNFNMELEECLNSPDFDLNPDGGLYRRNTRVISDRFRCTGVFLQVQCHSHTACLKYLRNLRARSGIDVAYC